MFEAKTSTVASVTGAVRTTLARWQNSERLFPDNPPTFSYCLRTVAFEMALHQQLSVFLSQLESGHHAGRLGGILLFSRKCHHQTHRSMGSEGLNYHFCVNSPFTMRLNL